MRDRGLNGLKFRRQQPLGQYVLDFVCPAARLVVEVDGPVHDTDEAMIQDTFRTDQLEAFGYRVIRVRNEDILLNLPAVLDHIAAEATSRLSVDADESNLQ